MRGSQVLKTWCITQTTVALSSAEADLVAAVIGAAEGLAVQVVACVFGCEGVLEVRMNSSAAIGIVRRSGVGKIRHLDTRLLLVQERMHPGDGFVCKVPGTENPADLLTKFFGQKDISSSFVRLNCWPAPHV